MTLSLTARPLEGSPAAVVPLERWLDDALMQRIAGKNNLANTAFVRKTGMVSCNLHWFTPSCEVDLCGPTSPASALWVIPAT
jgi:PhzF family phenazine biosynthesis protein